MSERIIELFIFDIYVAILKIKNTSSKFNNVQDLLYSYTDWDSIIREFEIIGEASKHLLKESLLPLEYRAIVDFRNYITHAYFGIDKDRIWSIIYKELNELEEIILNLIGKIKKPLKEELIDAFIEDNAYLDFVVKKLKELKD